jgi:hypothetical protein
LIFHEQLRWDEMNVSPISSVTSTSQVEAFTLRIFISYAAEGILIGTAIAKALRDALGDVFAELNIDRRFLEADGKT